jgi:hypothetical protein
LKEQQHNNLTEIAIIQEKQKEIKAALEIHVQIALMILEYMRVEIEKSQNAYRLL